MKIVRKNATITNTGDEDAFPGTFELVLSTADEDRDGDELLEEDWEQPLPDHITMDEDHGMSVATTVGSGVPTIEGGKVIVRGTYSSLQRAQDVRTLVNEKHIRTASVAFMTKTVTKDGKSKKVRELLNGAFVAVPSNRSAVILDSKGAKAGARNSKSDAEHIQAIHDHAIALGATPAGPSDDTGAAEGTVGGKALHRMVAAKAVDGSYEQRQQAICDALDAAYPDPPDGGYVYAYPLATFEDSVVYRVSGDTELRGQWQADYTYDNGKVTLGDPVAVNMVEQVVPLAKSLGLTLTGVADDDAAPVEPDEPAAADDATAADAAAAKSAAADPDVDLQFRAFVTRASALAAS
ncbi:MAG TPA: hypothetical protein VJ851_00675 [Jatrophihabitans sp.]|nr:hypothetical protein [Jatrophihabitans sp.]